MLCLIIHINSFQAPEVQLKLQSSFLTFVVLFYEHFNFMKLAIYSDTSYSNNTDKTFKSFEID